MSRQRLLVSAGLLLIAATVAILLWPRTPRLVQDLRALPATGNVVWKGDATNYLTVLQPHDLPYITPEMAKTQDIDHAEYLTQAEKVQAEVTEILRFLITEHDVKTIYAEGVTWENSVDFGLNVTALRKLAEREDEVDLDEEQKLQQSILRLKVGAAGRVCEREKLDHVLPLLDPGKPAAMSPMEGKLDALAKVARCRAMLKNLPAQGLVVVVLNGSDDLGAYLPAGTRYVRVTVRG